jgi:hypothetical protein
LKPEEQNVVPSKLWPKEQNFIPLELIIDESSNQFALELAIMIVYNSNGGITHNIDWKFQWKNGGLDCFRIYVH